MSVIILLDGTKHLLPNLISFFTSSEVEVHKEDFLNTRSILSNIFTNKIYFLLNCDLKPYRYEIYCLVKKQEAGFCVITPNALSSAKHDNPHIVVNETSTIDSLVLEINSLLENKLRATTAHKRKFINDNNYLSNVKRLINKINNEYEDTLQIIKKNCEQKLLKMLSINIVDIKEIENLYRNMLEKQ